MNFWILCFPDIEKPVGGVKQMHRLAEALDLLGHKAFLVQDNSTFHPHWFTSAVTKVSKDEFFQRHLDPLHNICIIAETFLPILPKLQNSLPIIIFNQNSSYTFGLSKEAHFKSDFVRDCYLNNPSIRGIWCVSQHDRSFLVNGLGVPSSTVFQLKNCLESICNENKGTRKHQVVFMPRKNPRDVYIVTSLLSTKPFMKGFSLVSLDNLPHSQVIDHFHESLVYLSFGHPEGFGLPVAEAMACGCAVVGYSGLGGSELFVLSNALGVSIEVQFGNICGFVTGLEKILMLYIQDPKHFTASLSSNSQYIRNNYSFSSFKQSLAASLNALKL